MLYYISEHRSWKVVVKYAVEKIVNTMTQSYNKDSIDIFTKIWMLMNVQHEP